MNASFCPVCGKALTGRFCGGCGTDSANIAAAAPPSSPPGPPAAAPATSPPTAPPPPSTAPPASPPTMPLAPPPPVSDGREIKPPDLSQAVDYIKANAAMTAGFAESLRQRPGFTVGGVLTANAAFLFGLAGVLLFAGEAESSTPVILIGALLSIVGWSIALGIRFLIGSKYPSVTERLLPFATVMTVFGLALFVVGLAVASVEDSRSVSTAVAWWPYLLLSFILFIVWLLPGLQGRPFVLGVALVNLTWAFSGLVAVSVNERQLRSSAESLFSTGGYLYNPQEVFESAAAAGLSTGLLFLIAVLAFDWIGWRGLATPFLVAGVFATLAGAFGVASDASVLSVGFLALCIIFILLIGVLGRRKATIWIGGLMLSPALIAMCVKLLGDDPSPMVAGVFVGFVGLIVAATAAISLFYGPVIVARYESTAQGLRASVLRPGEETA